MLSTQGKTLAPAALEGMGMANLSNQASRTQQSVTLVADFAFTMVKL